MSAPRGACYVAWKTCDMRSLAFSEPRPNHENVRCATNRLKFHLSAENLMIASQPSLDNNNSSGIVSVLEGNFEPASKERNMFVTCFPSDTAVSYRHLSPTHRRRELCTSRNFLSKKPKRSHQKTRVTADSINNQKEKACAAITQQACFCMWHVPNMLTLQRC